MPVASDSFNVAGYERRAVAYADGEEYGPDSGRHLIREFPSTKEADEGNLFLGNSMAAAQVAALAGLLVGRSPGLSPSEIIEHIKRSVVTDPAVVENAADFAFVSIAGVTGSDGKEARVPPPVSFLTAISTLPIPTASRRT
jgi:subtilisin family serine protease